MAEHSSIGTTWPTAIKILPIPEPQASMRASEIQPLIRAFFSRDPRRVARSLLGKVLVRETKDVDIYAAD